MCPLLKTYFNYTIHIINYYLFINNFHSVQIEHCKLNLKVQGGIFLNNSLL